MTPALAMLDAVEGVGGGVGSGYGPGQQRGRRRRRLPRRRPGSSLAATAGDGRRRAVSRREEDRKSVDEMRGLVDRFQKENRGARAPGVVPVRMALPHVGSSLYLVSELTPERVAPEATFTYKREEQAMSATSRPIGSGARAALLVAVTVDVRRAGARGGARSVGVDSAAAGNRDAAAGGIQPAARSLVGDDRGTRGSAGAGGDFAGGDRPARQQRRGARDDRIDRRSLPLGADRRVADFRRNADRRAAHRVHAHRDATSSERRTARGRAGAGG